MRLPLSKPWRAYPELDAYSDEQCRYLLNRAKRAWPKLRVGLVLQRWIANVLMLGYVALVGLCVSPIAVWFNKQIGEPTNAVEDVLYFVPIFVLILIALSPLLVIQLWFYQRKIHAVLADRLELSRCPGCRYPLIGQRTVNGVVTCPECDRGCLLIELGLTEEDLLPPA
ncbi:MAG: hypothetical protein AAGH88_06185 [Planctomycetota bacterium]